MKKKIISGVVLGIVILLVVAIFVLYFVRVNYAPKLADPDTIQVYKTDTGTTFNSSEDAYKNILNAYNNSFNQSLLTAIFAGQTGDVSGQTTSGELNTTNSLSASPYYIEFNYNQAQTLVVNGHEQDKKINQVVVEVKDSSSYEKVKIYYQQAEVSGKYYYMTAYSNQGALYDIIENLNLPN